VQLSDRKTANPKHPVVNEALRTIGALFEPGDVIEIRALDVGRTSERAGTTHAGYFNFENHEAIAAAIRSLDGRSEGIYVVLNRINATLLSRSANRLRVKPKHTTTDADIVEWLWLYIDADAIRSAGISATDAEHEAALQRITTFRDFLRDRRWPEPIHADSGNGGHLHYRIPVLDVKQAGDLVKRCLHALSARFSDSVVKVDESTATAARLCKLYGTLTRKGDSTPDRPHRRSALLATPERIEPVSIEALEALAAEVPATPKSAKKQNPSGRGAFDVEGWLAQSGLQVITGPEPYNGGRRWILRECPFNSEHDKPAVIELDSGALVFKFLHKSCAENDWKALRHRFDPDYRERVQPPISVNRGNAESEPKGAVRVETEIGEGLPDFPESAWRGVFADYREAMAGTTEASDVAHFATLWAGAAVSLGRRVSIYAGEWTFANVYLSVFGSTGDKKTTAQRRILNQSLLPPSVRVIQNVGSTEGLADALKRDDGADAVALFFWEELTALLARGRWSGSTILEFITETFDCPAEWGLRYRKDPVKLVAPTPTILAGTTCEWFWKNARSEDFFGGFGNRFLYLTGPKKEPIPTPIEPARAALQRVRSSLARLQGIHSVQAHFDRNAEQRWAPFYMSWEHCERTGLYAAAVRRVHVYIRKLAMTYAALEGTLPEISIDQLEAAIAVGEYAAQCAQVLIDAQTGTPRSESHLEQKFMKWLESNEGAKKRYMQQTLQKSTGGCEVFNRVLLNLERADMIFIRDNRVYVTR
jgi:hypothetical protein